MVRAQSLNYVLVSQDVFFSFVGLEPYKLTRHCTYGIQFSLTRRTLDARLAEFDNAREVFVVSEPACKQVVKNVSDESSVES
jgi:hypothetical protein